MEQVAGQNTQTASESGEAPNFAETADSGRASARRHAQALTLEQETGWRWDASELGHFRTRPKSFPPDVLKWRRELVASASRGRMMLLAHLADQAAAEIRAQLDGCLAVLREVARVLAVSNAGGDIPPARRSGSGGPIDLTLCPSQFSAAALRVFTRISPFHELGVEWSEDADTQKIAKAWDLVPPVMRPQLQLQLEQHARRICHADAPDCVRCTVASLCRMNRRTRLAAAEKCNNPTFIDMFSGAGGASCGFSRAGFRPLLAIDSNAAACDTYRLNHCEIPDGDVLCADIRELQPGEINERLGGRQLDVLIGAPPCQGFSSAGMRSKQSLAARKSLGGYSVCDDGRNYLFQFVVEAAVELRPKLVLMENVPGMDSPRPGGAPSFMKMAEQMLRDAGFITVIWKLDAGGYGVPQRRVRNFLVASSTGRLPNLPEAEFQHTATRSLDPDALPPITLDAALFDLPPISSDDGAVVMRDPSVIPDDDRRYRFFLRNRRFPIKQSLGLIYNHKSRYQNERDLELYSLLQPGEDSVHLIERYGRTDLMLYRLDVFDDKYARLRPDQPSKTIVSHLAKDGNSYIHPTQTRSITPREAARLQSFPDDYIFCGAPSDQWIQIGNSVPPALAAAIAHSFRDFLNRERCR